MNHESLLIKIGGTGQSYFTLRQVVTSFLIGKNP
jgi:hypothetical protein